VEFYETLIGKKFGNLTLMSCSEYYTEPSVHRRRVGSVRGSCGKEYQVYLTKLLSNKGPFSCKACSYDIKR